MRKWIKYITFVTVFLCGLTLGRFQARAEDKIIPLTADEEKYVTLYVGDTGKIVPDNSVSEGYGDNSWYDNDWYEDAGEGYESVAISSAGNIPVSYTYAFSDEAWNWSGHCMTLNADGSFTATAPGTESVEVIGYSSDGSAVFFADVYFTVQLDMSNVTLQKTKLKGYLFAAHTYGDYVWYQDAQFTIPISSPIELDDEMEGLNFNYASSNDEVSVYATLEKNKLYLNLNAQKKCSTVVTVSIGGKEFKISVSLQPVRISNISYLLEKGHTKKLTLKGYSGKVAWSSTNPKIASVSKDGVVKGKQIGNVVITAKIGDQRVGCAVSVTTATLKKVCTRGTYIGTNWTYNQAKRDQSGYYDCSALVWKAYKQYTKIDFGSSSYPGTTKTESAWCRNHGKLIKGGYSYKKVEKMQLNPGDIVFKSDNLKKPYTTTYHVEMFTGYACMGYDSDGKPIVEAMWASRGIGYGVAEGSLLARPTK